jgi:hypothetical protein
MRFLALALIALLAAGCVTPPGSNNAPPANNSTTSGSRAMLPPPINDTKEVQGGGEPLTPPTGACSTPGAKCFRYPFQLNATAHVVATLTWGLPASDFDLFVNQDGKAVKMSAGSPPGTSEKIDDSLDAGKYEVVVSAAAVSQDTYKLAVVFSSP